MSRLAFINVGVRSFWLRRNSPFWYHSYGRLNYFWTHSMDSHHDPIHLRDYYLLTRNDFTSSYYYYSCQLISFCFEKNSPHMGCYLMFLSLIVIICFDMMVTALCIRALLMSLCNFRYGSCLGSLLLLMSFCCVFFKNKRTLPTKMQSLAFIHYFTCISL